MKKKKNNSQGFEILNRSTPPEMFHTSLSELFVAKILQRFTIKRIGISITQEQQQMPAYVYIPIHWKNRNAWSWGGNN